MASGYGMGGASNDKRVFKSFLNKLLSGSAQQDIDFNNFDLRQRSRLLYMTEPIAASLINQPRNNVVGLGIFAKPRIDYEFLGIPKKTAMELQRSYESEYRLWSEDKYAVDATGINDIYGLQQLAFTAWLLSGDCFCLFKSQNRTDLRPYSLRLHVQEADRCCTPATVFHRSVIGKAKNGNKIFDGVEIDDSGLVVAYYMCNKYPQDHLTVFDRAIDWKRIEVLGRETGLPNILHIMNSERPDQYRGVPFLAKVIEPLLQIRRYREAELMAAVIQAFFTVFITKNGASDGMPKMNEVVNEGEEVSTREDEYEMGPGNINYLEEGEDAKFAQPSHPNSGFGAFCDVVIQHIASALGEPKESVLMCYTASYSASRAALQEAWKTYRMFRKWFVDDFCRPIYERWFTEAVALGRIKAPGFFNDPQIRRAYLRCEWIGPAPGMIDPIKDIKSSKMACDYAFSTGETETMRLYGGDIYANIAQRGLELDLMKEAGIVLEKEMDVPAGNNNNDNPGDDIPDSDD